MLFNTQWHKFSLLLRQYSNLAKIGTYPRIHCCNAYHHFVDDPSKIEVNIDLTWSNMFSHSSADNSKANRPNQPEFELFRDLMVVVVTWMISDYMIKSEVTSFR